MKQERYKKPNAFSYGIGRLVSFFYTTFRLNHRFIRNELRNIRGPAVVLGNHASSCDQFIACRSCRRRITYVISEAMYYTLPAPWFFSSLHLIKKQQFFTSLADIRNMKDVIRNNGILLLYPAGVVPSCGKSTKLLSATGKFLKMLRADTYIIREHGMNISNPKWQDEIRKGKPETEVFRLFTADELRELSPEEVFVKTSDALDFDDYEWQETRMVGFKGGNRTEGLENVLHSCPVCSSRFSIVNTDNSLTCSACGFSTKADDYGFLHSDSEGFAFRHPSVWESAIHSSIRESMAGNPGFTYSSKALITRLDKDLRCFSELGKGSVTVTGHEISIVLDSGENCYRESTVHFPILPMIPGKYFDLQDGSTVFRCYPEEKKDVAYVTDIVSCMAELRETQRGKGIHFP